MQDKTINNALLALRREGGEVQELADQLLRMRGIEPPRIRRYCKNPLGRRQMRQAVLEALRDGPQTGPDVVRHVMQYRPDLTFRQAQGRVSTVLTKMKHQGLVRRDGRVWGLTQCG